MTEIQIVEKPSRMMYATGEIVRIGEQLKHQHIGGIESFTFFVGQIPAKDIALKISEKGYFKIDFSVASCKLDPVKVDVGYTIHPEKVAAYLQDGELHIAIKF